MSGKAKSFQEFGPGLRLEAALDEAYRCLQCEDPPCEKGCPAKVGIRKFIRKIRNFDFRGAAQVIRRAWEVPLTTTPKFRLGSKASATAERSCIGRLVMDMMRSMEIGSFCIPRLTLVRSKTGMSNR